MPIFNLGDSPPVADEAIPQPAAVTYEVLENSFSRSVHGTGAGLSVGVVGTGQRVAVEPRRAPGLFGSGARDRPVHSGRRPGTHRLEGRYQPPGLFAAGPISAIAVLVVFILMAQATGSARRPLLIP